MLKVIDNFYNNVDSVREFALKQDYLIKGNFPGQRTVPHSGKEHKRLKEVLQKAVGKEITFWPGVYNTSFQYTTKRDTTWIHHDNVTNMAGLIYLTPNAPLNSGTSFYQHRESGVHTYSPEQSVDYNKLGLPFKDWVETDRVANYYNRLVIYDANKYHCSTMAGFGNSVKTGRLFQTFFFSVK